MNREAAVRAAAEALRAACPDAGCQGHTSEAADAVDAAAPHLTADLVEHYESLNESRLATMKAAVASVERERDEALAEVGRLRAHAEDARGFRDAWKARAEKAEAAIGRVEALCRIAENTHDSPIWPHEVLAALRGDQP